MTAPDDVAAGLEEIHRPAADRSIGTLLADIAADLRKLFRLELALFKLELTEKARRLNRGLAAVAVAVFFAVSGWLVLLAAAVLGLSIFLRPWLAALIVGSAALLIAALLVLLGKRWLNPQRLAPRRTVNALREDASLIKERLS